MQVQLPSAAAESLGSSEKSHPGCHTPVRDSKTGSFRVHWRPINTIAVQSEETKTSLFAKEWMAKRTLYETLSRVPT